VLLIGVVGEGAFEGLVSEADGWLQEFNNILLSSQQSEIRELGDITAQARKDATEASKAAGTAKTASQLAVTESRRAEIASSNAMQLARSFEKDIKDAKRDASEAKALLAEVRHLAADAESRAAEAERKVADRHISAAQTELIHKSLARWSGEDIRLPMVTVNGDGESSAYAKELLSTLGSISGWSIRLTAESRNAGMSGLNVRIEQNSSALDKVLASDIVAALHGAGVQASGPGGPLEGYGVAGSLNSGAQQSALLACDGAKTLSATVGRFCDSARL
jgi:hypothetical protein